MDWMYRGYRKANGYASRVTVQIEGGRVLPLVPTKLAKQKSPTGFEWGYNGSGPSALAHTILHREMGQEIADKYYQAFKQGVIAALPHSEPGDEDEHLDWEMSSRTVALWYELHCEMHPPTAGTLL